MAGSRIKGITVEIGGDTTGLDKALKGVNSTIRTTQTSLKDVNKLLKLDPANTNLVTQKQKLLKDAIKDTKDRLGQLKDAQSKLKEGTAEYDALQREIIDTEQQLKSLEKAYKDFGSVASQQLKSVGDKVKEVGGKIKDAGADMTARFTVPIVAGFTAASKYASDYEENLNKIDVAFGGSADEVKEWASTATEQFGLSMVAATEATSSFGALAKGIGLSEGSAADMSTTLAGLSADLSSYFNVGTDEAAQALSGIFTGETESLKKFGIVMNETNLEKFAKDHGKVWKECSQSEKTMLRYQYVLENTSDAQGDYARTSDGTANSVRTFQATMENLATTTGQQVLPIITPLIQKVTEFIAGFQNLSPEVQQMIVYIGMFVAAAGPVLVIIGTLVSAIGSIIGAIGAVIGFFAPIIAGISAILGSVASVQGALFLLGTILTGPVGIVAAIAAVVAAGVALWKNWDTVKGKAKELKDNVVAAWETFKQNTSTKFNEIKDKISQKVQEAKDKAVQKATDLKDSVVQKFTDIKDKAKEKFEDIKNSISEKINGAKDKVKEAIEKIKGFFDFKVSFPHIKLPHFSVSGSANPLDWLSQGVPHISVKWYKTAMDNGAIFTNPTIFGMANGKMLGAGDAGPEALIGVSSLRNIIREAVAEVGSNDPAVLYSAVKAGMEDADVGIYIDARQFGRMLKGQGVAFT